MLYQQQVYDFLDVGDIINKVSDVPKHKLDLFYLQIEK
jgi:hypothetical protein